MYTTSVFISIGVLACLHFSIAQISVVEIKLENLLKMQTGLGWPHNLTVIEGHQVLLSLGSTLQEQEACTVTTPSGLTFNVNNPPDVQKYESWGSDCGLRVRNVVMADQGRWRLTASRGEDSIVGWTEVVVRAATNSYTATDIFLQDGLTHTEVSLTTLDNSYCVVAQPFSESSLVPGHCSVTLDRTTRAVQGNWNILLGIPGRVEELHVERHVTVQAERLDVGYVHATAANALHLYCNLQHSMKNITFCRFQRTNNMVGYNVADGLSDGTHSYYGDGFLQKQCGITIEAPTADDYTTWRCSVGVQVWVDEAIVQQTPMQALISVAPSTLGNTLLLNDDDRTIFVEGNRSFTLMCRASVSLSYCWFQHPNGTQFTPIHLASEEQLFWYTGESLQAGDCGLTFNNAKTTDEGEWVCHMGQRDRTGLEVTDNISVRVTGPLAANEKEVRANIGDRVTLYCHTANGRRPLDYCRFLSPSFIGLNMDETITEDNPVMGRYFFTPERNPDFGDCSLTIGAVAPEDFGIWTCAALINEDIVESRDTMVLQSGSFNFPVGQAGIIGMTAGLVVLVMILIGAILYGRSRSNRNAPAAGSRAGSNVDIIPMDVLNNPSIGRASINSDDRSSLSSGADHESVILNVSRPASAVQSQRERSAAGSALNDRPGVSEVRSRQSATSSLGRRGDIPLSTIERPRPRSASSSRSASRYPSFSHRMSISSTVI